MIINKSLIDDENVYADLPLNIGNDNNLENRETSIEIGLGEIGINNNEIGEGGPNEMQFNVTVLGRHKISSKEYK